MSCEQKVIERKPFNIVCSDPCQSCFLFPFAFKSPLKSVLLQRLWCFGFLEPHLCSCSRNSKFAGSSIFIAMFLYWLSFPGAMLLFPPVSILLQLGISLSTSTELGFVARIRAIVSPSRIPPRTTLPSL